MTETAASAEAASSSPVGGSGSSQGPTAASSAPAEQPASRSGIKLGLIGVLSGPAGELTQAFPLGTQVWAKWVNSRGGVAGHSIQVIVADDGGDPARHLAAVKNLVEQQRVLALINTVALLTGNTSIEYLESKRIPTVGMSGGEAWAYSSRMLFPHVTSGPAFVPTFFASTAGQAVPKGKAKVGIIVCAEVQICRDVYDGAEREAPKRGLTVVYKAKVSIGQPDFTAECLAARNAGAESLLIGSDPSSFRRVVSSCSRQSFRPLFVTPGQAIVDDMRSIPALQDNFFSNLVAFPYFQSNTPATAEFQQAFKTFGSSVKLTASLPIAWAGGKLFERAAAKIGEHPTTETLLEGLWSIKSDDLGGITHPLTYVKDEPAPPSSCWFDVTISEGAWSTPDGFRRHCV